MYVAYHMTSDPTKYGGEGTIKYVYYFILFSHILLSVTVIPFVLVTYVRALTGNFEGHRKIAKNYLSNLVICSCNWGYSLCYDFSLLLE